MATSAEKQALGFLILVALTGGAVRAVGVKRFEGESARAVHASPGSGGRDAVASQLARQLDAVDSARSAGAARGRSGGKSGARPGGGRRSGSRAAANRPTLDEDRLGATTSTPVDVNTAGAPELERLPRVGPSLAARIVAWREQHGPFAGPDDLRHVRGIGPATVRLIDSLVTFSGRHRP